MLINQANIWVTLPRLCGILSACRVPTVMVVVGEVQMDIDSV